MGQKSTPHPLNTSTTTGGHSPPDPQSVNPSSATMHVDQAGILVMIGFCYLDSEKRSQASLNNLKEHQHRDCRSQLTALSHNQFMFNVTPDASAWFKVRHGIERAKKHKSHYAQSDIKKVPGRGPEGLPQSAPARCLDGPDSLGFEFFDERDTLTYSSTATSSLSLRMGKI